MSAPASGRHVHCISARAVVRACSLQVAERPVLEPQTPSPQLDAVIAEFSVLPNPQDRLKLLLQYGKQLEPLAAAAKTDANRVMGCTAQVSARHALATQPAPHTRCFTVWHAQLVCCGGAKAGTAADMILLPLQAWIDARLDADGHVQLSGDSDSALTRGLAAVLVHSLSGLTPEEVLAVEPASLAGLVSRPAVL